MYILEVQKYDTCHENLCAFKRNCVHVGYMKKEFQTQQDACDYYDTYNPHMRSLNAFGNWISDWDPRTQLLYIVRPSYREKLTISPFPE